jgi:hypothetical protein
MTRINMTRINMTRINALRNIAGTRDSVAWGKEISNAATATWGSINALVFAAALIVCSVTVGCTSSNTIERPQPVSSNSQIPGTQASRPMLPAPVMQAEKKPAPKKVAHKKPATVYYADKTYGVTFEYPRRYAIETGNAAADLLTSTPVPMNFVQPGGIALAAVELPETSFANTDFSSAFFNVSVHKTLTADQCSEFAVPMPKQAAVSESKPAEASAPTAEPSAAKVEPVTPVAPSTEAASAPVTTAPIEAAKAASPETQTASTQPAAPETGAAPAQPSSTKASNEPAATSPAGSPVAGSSATSATVSIAQPASNSKLLLGDMELRATEAVSGEGTRQSDSKYFHVYQNGSCYEFALNVTTLASSDGIIKHVDRDKVFSRLEQILGTVKINPVEPEVAAQTPATQPAGASPAQ